MIERLTIKDVLENADYGATAPVWIRASNNKTYLLKFRHEKDAEKDISNFNEFLAFMLMKELGLKIYKYNIAFIDINEQSLQLFHNKVSAESLINAHNSIGTNIGILKIENSQKFKPSDIDNMPKSLIKRIANIDNIMMNSDRTADNPNMLYDPKNKSYSPIDFGLSLLSHRVYDAIKNGDVLNERYLNWTVGDATKDRHYLFKNQNKLNFNRKYNSIIQTLDNIIEQCPQEWEVLKYVDVIKDIVAWRIVNNTFGNACPCYDF
ncbi:HipA family kinase [Campylobacter sp. MOP7]|uniref:HipA family kinase n=1 Tax=Campylobacter canis TaxID=3378588 RepID=UPI00387E9543